MLQPPATAQHASNRLPRRRVGQRRRGEGLVVFANWGADVQFSPAKVLERKPAATQVSERAAPGGVLR